VGTVCFAWILPNDAIYSETKLFKGNRKTIREQACEFALQRLLELVINQ
jgi:nicotinamide-nucleotide amidase